MISILPMQCNIFNIQIRGLISYRKSDVYRGSRISYRKSDIHIGSRISYRKSDIISEVGYTYRKSDIHIGGQIYILEVGYIYRNYKKVANFMHGILTQTAPHTYLSKYAYENKYIQRKVSCIPKYAQSMLYYALYKG